MSVIFYKWNKRTSYEIAISTNILEGRRYIVIRFLKMAWRITL